MNAMKRLVFLLAVPLLLLALTANTASGPAAGTAKPAKLRTLVTTSGIEAFAQDTDSLAWVDYGHAVHIKRVSKPGQSVVGWVETDVTGGGPVPPPELALAGVRALWPGYAGGASRETVIKTGALGERPKKGERRAAIVTIFSYSNDTYTGTYLAGLAGDGPTLVFGYTDEVCPGELCRLFEVAGGGVTRVISRRASARIPGVDPPAMLAASHGRIADVPATEVPWPGAGIPSLPAVAENGPVEVYDLAGRKISTVNPVGTVRVVALSWPQLGVLVRRHDRTQAIERYNATSGALIATTVVPSTAADLALGTGGPVYRVGRAIYTIRAGHPALVWRAKAQPIGLSIEGRRVAWAVNLEGRGRIVALTLR